MIRKALMGSIVLVAAVLAVFYLGNQVVQTTPLSSADGPFQYDVMDSPAECMQKLAELYTSAANNSESIAAAQQTFHDCIVNKLNEKGAQGWELILVQGTPPSQTYIFKK